MTEACKQQTADLLKQMDRTVDPCQDFYQFACGGFINNTVLANGTAIAGERKKSSGNYRNIIATPQLRCRSLPVVRS